MNGALDDIVRKLKAAGEPTRLRALYLLSQGELSVGELAQLLGQSQPGLSRHMKFLTDAGLVERLPEGAWVFYRLTPRATERRAVDTVLSLVNPGAADFVRDLERLKQIRAQRASEAEAFFNSTADRWDELRSLHFSNDAIESAVRDMAGPGPFQRVIDIGTGTGRMLAMFAQISGSGEGIDISHRMLTLARSNLDRFGVRNAQVRQGDALSLPFPAASADLVIIHQVLHFLDDPRAAVAEASRILMPGGRLLVVDFAPHDLEFLRSAHGHRRLGIRSEEIDSWASGSGLDALDLRRFDPPGLPDGGLGVLVWSFTRPGATHAAGPAAASLHQPPAQTETTS